LKAVVYWSAKESSTITTAMSGLTQAMSALADANSAIHGRLIDLRHDRIFEHVQWLHPASSHVS
jgi:hypothetical protein